MYFFPAFVLFMALAACSSDETNDIDIFGDSLVRNDTITFTASQESSSATRAYVGENKAIYWDTDDKISIFDGSANCEFSLSGGAGTSFGSFTGSASSVDNYTAVYPYTEGAELNDDGSVSGVVLPSEQTATVGSFDPKAILMMGKSNSNDKTKLQFKNAISYFKFQTDFKCSKVILRSTGINMPIAGKGTLKWNNSAPYIDFSSSNQKSTTITLSGEILANKIYYIIIPPNCPTKNWYVTFVSSEDSKTYIHKMGKEITIGRNEISNLGSLSKSSTTYWANPDKGIVDSTQEVDLGLTIKQNGKDYKVIFTKTNLTAFGLATNETDFGDYFAWAATEPWCTSYKYTSGDTFTPETWLYGKENHGYTVSYLSSYDGNVLKPSDDAARVILGGNWQIPSQEIWTALLTCEKEWDDKKGYTFKSKSDNGNTLFLPAAGQFYQNMNCESIGTLGCYRTNSTASSNQNSDYLTFQSGSFPQSSIGSWEKGTSIRPVRLDKTTSK